MPLPDPGAQRHLDVGRQPGPGVVDGEDSGGSIGTPVTTLMWCWLCVKVASSCSCRAGHCFYYEHVEQVGIQVPCLD